MPVQRACTLRYVNGQDRRIGRTAPIALTIQDGADMQPTDILAQTGGLQAIARELGVTESQAETGAAALLPAILGGFKKQATQPAGIGGLGDLLGKLGGGSLLDDVVAPHPTNVGRGNEVLGEIFGSKDVSRTVAQDASAKTGLDPALLKKMLPILTMLVAGYMAKQRGAGAAGASPSAGGGLGGILGGMLGGQGRAGGLGSMLDMNGDGNPLDDILRMAGRKKG
jgi:hypothetical protein